MSILKFTVGKRGAGGANSDYITRLSAAEKISFHNLGHLESDDVIEARTNAIAYAHAREEIELAKNEKARTHYRLIASFEGKKTSEEAAEEVGKYLKKEFPQGRAIIAVHQDTDYTHVHIWLDSRKTGGRKIQIDDKQYHSLDERWTKQYDDAYGTNYAPEYKAKKEETKQYKKEMLEWRARQADASENTENVVQALPPAKSERASDRMKRDYWRAKEVQELSVSKELPTLRNENKPAATESHKPVQLIEERKQIIELQVESYMLDLQKMMRERREILIKETYQACYSNLVRRGIPTDKVHGHVVAAVDHFIDKGAYQVRIRIRECLKYGSHVGEQITLSDKSGGEAVDNILRNAADASHHAIVECALENHCDDFHQNLYKPFSLNAQRAVIKSPIDQQTEGNYAKNGLGAGYSIAQTGSRSAQNSERAQLGAKSDSARNYQPAERRTAFAEILEQAQGRAAQTAGTGDYSQGRGTDIIRRTEQTFGGLSQSDDLADRESGADFGQSEVSQFSGDAVKSDEFPGTQLHDVSDSIAKPLANEFADERKSAKYFYEDQFGDGQFGARAGAANVSGSLAGAENFAVTAVDLPSFPQIEAFEPQFAVNQKALAEEIMKMMKASLAAQDLKISLRAEKMYEHQLIYSAKIPVTEAQTEIANKLNEDRPVEDRFSVSGKSKLEATYIFVSKLNDKERDEAFAVKAKALEKEVRREQIEEFQERQGMTFSM